MIEVIYKKKKVKTKPHYILEYKYKIGSSVGYTSKEVELSMDNPYIERYVVLLNSLNPTKGTWGLILDPDKLNKVHLENQINEDDYDFLKKTMFISYYEDEYEDESDDKFLYEFYEGVTGETEYSFLVFQGATLFYIDENGEKFNTKFVEDKK